MRRYRSHGGFTLIELMIVVVIVGILAALAVPRFTVAATKSKQAEAKAILKQIYVNERTYRQQGNTYYIPAGPASAVAPYAFQQIWVSIMPSARYTYTIVGTTNAFTATAVATTLDDDATQDVWQINDQGILICLSDDALI